MDILLQQIINGLILGSLYALVALGYTMGLPTEDRYLQSKSEFEDKIAGMLAGAIYGHDALPVRWLKALDPVAREACATQARKLVALTSA